jgi:hypothetical protein
MMQIPPFVAYALPLNPLVSLPREYHGWQVEILYTALARQVVHPSWYSHIGSTMPIITLASSPLILDP